MDVAPAQLASSGEPHWTTRSKVDAARGESAETTERVRNLSRWSALRCGLQRWAYVAEDGRDLRIDLLRGLAVLAMVVDHVAGPSKLYLLTGGNHFYTSAAEGFIFLSGLTVGLVYRRVAERQGLATAIRRLLGRAWTLYLLAVGLTLVMLPFSEVLRLPWAVGIEETTPLQIVWAILSLHQTYYLVDVIALYVLLILAAPLALFLLCEGRTVYVLLGSWLIWAGFQFFPLQTELPWVMAGNNLFYFSAWQTLFFTAMVIGYHRGRLSASVGVRWQLPLLVATGLGFAGLIVLYSNQSAVLQSVHLALADAPGRPSWSVADLEDALFAKGAVGAGRVLASAVVFAFFFQLITVFWAPLRRGLGWLLIALGQNALYAYSTHVMLALALGFLNTRIVLGDRTWLNAAIQTGSIGLIWLAIRLRVLYPTPATRRLWMLTVVPLAVTAVAIFRLDPSPAVPVAAADTIQATSESNALRRARAFGTPIPRTVGASPGMQVASPSSQAASGPVDTAIASATPQMPLPALVVAERAAPSAAQYVGAIDGTFREMVFYSPALDREMSYYIYSAARVRHRRPPLPGAVHAARWRWEQGRMARLWARRRRRPLNRVEGHQAAHHRHAAG